MKALIAVALLFVSSWAYADCDDIVVGGEPTIENSVRLCRAQEAYLTVYNPDCKVPYYSAEIITARNLEVNAPRKNTFKEDPNLPDNMRSTLADYKGTGFDRGHMAPAADFHYSADAMAESFLLSNMVPQYHNPNAGVWSSVESFAREKASQGAVHVISGPIIDRDPKRIGNGVCVPSHTFKIVVDANNRTTSFMIPNTPTASSEPLESYTVPVEEIEAKSGIKFNVPH